MNYECIVLGAGVNGLATAHCLRQQGVRSLAVLEQFRLAHGLGSSHGRSRITRSSYSSSSYVELMQWVHGQGWPQWEAEAGQPLLHPTPGLFFGPGVEAYWDSLRQRPEVLPQIEDLTPEAARKRFLPFLFPDSPRVLVDHTCAVVAADRTLRFLAQGLQGQLIEECQVLSIESGTALKLTTSQGVMECQRLVVTAGPWAARLLPALAPHLRPAHQDVGYFRAPGLTHTGAGDFPVWVYTGQRADDSFYGLPEFERPGLKLARHRTGPHGDDPDRPVSEHLPQHAEEDLARFAAWQWSCSLELVGYDACIYTNTVSEDFLLDRWPEDPRIVVGVGFSGHGFKFAPLTGRVLADLAVHGHTRLPVFERHRQQFSVQAGAHW